MLCSGICFTCGELWFKRLLYLFCFGINAESCVEITYLLKRKIIFSANLKRSRRLHVSQA